MSDLARALRAIGLAAAVAVLGSCGGDDDGPAGPTGREGALSYSYAGDLSGTFGARGTFPEGAGDLPLGTWAAAARAAADSIAVVAVRERSQSPPRADVSGLFLPRVTAPATLQVSAACAGDACPQWFLFLNADVTGDAAAFEWGCAMLVGTVRVTSLSAARVAGTFNGTAGCIRGVTGEDVEATLTVTNGSFDVPFVSGLGAPVAAHRTRAYLHAARRHAVDVLRAHE